MAVTDVGAVLGWKVLRQREEGLWSAVAHEDGEVMYGEYSWTHPRPDCGPLTFFRNREAARAFRDNPQIAGTVIRRVLAIPWWGEAKVWDSRRNVIDEEVRFEHECRLEECAKGTALAAAIMVLPEESKETSLGVFLQEPVKLTEGTAQWCRADPETGLPYFCAPPAWSFTDPDNWLRKRVNGLQERLAKLEAEGLAFQRATGSRLSKDARRLDEIKGWIDDLWDRK